MYYELINKFPLSKWRACLEGDHSYTRMDLDVGSEDQDEASWEVLYNQYLDKFGLGDDQKRMFDLKKEIAFLQINYVIDGNEFLKNNINRLESELNEILKRPVEGSFDECIIYLSKWLGYHFDQDIRTVVDFHTSMDLYRKEADKLREMSAKK